MWQRVLKAQREEWRLQPVWKMGRAGGCATHVRQGKAQSMMYSERRKMLSFLPMDIKVKNNSKHRVGTWSSNLDCDWCDSETFRRPHLGNADTTALPTQQAFRGGQIMRKCPKNCKVPYKRKSFLSPLLGNPVSPSSRTVSHRNLTLQDENIPMTSFICCLWNHS